MKSATLFHLVSEQTMQNLLPLLALRPARVVQLCSQGERYQAAARHIENAAREAGVNVEFQPHPLEKEFPDVATTRHALKQLLSVFPDAVVNVTGGTKLMSIGAFLGASEFSSVPMLYCDTDRQAFISLGKTPLPAMPSFAHTARSLTLRVVMAAHGKAPDAWRFGVATPAQLAFGRRAFELRWNSADDFLTSEFSKRIRAFFRCEKDNIPGTKTKLESIVQTNLLEVLPQPLPPAVSGFLEAAASAGFLCHRAAGGLGLTSRPTDGQTLRHHVQRMANLLDGSWFELTVLDLVSRSSQFIDPHWSVEPVRNPAHEEARSFGETDVVCLGLPQGNLHVISCKTGLKQPLEHLESLRERSQNLGGRYAKASLAVLFAPGGRAQELELRRWGKLLGVEILLGDEVVRRFGGG